MRLPVRSGLFSFLLLLSGTASMAQVNNWEYDLLRSIARHRSTAGNHFHKDLSKINGGLCLAVPATLFVTGLINKDKNMKEKALYITESLVVSSVITWGMKEAVNRKRPANNDPSFTAVLDLKNNSFPSGHTSEAFSMATAVSIAYPRWYVIAPAFAYASLAGYSRLYLGVHYPTDVLAGAIVGSGSAWLSYKINQWIRQGQKKKKQAVIPE